MTNELVRLKPTKSSISKKYEFVHMELMCFFLRGKIVSDLKSLRNIMLGLANRPRFI